MRIFIFSDGMATHSSPHRYNRRLSPWRWPSYESLRALSNITHSSYTDEGRATGGAWTIGSKMRHLLPGRAQQEQLPLVVRE